MDDSSPEEETEVETFTLERSASEMHSLLLLMDYCAINIDDERFSTMAQQISLEIQKELGSDKFSQALEEEMEEARQFVKDQMSPPTTNGHGVQ